MSALRHNNRECYIMHVCKCKYSFEKDRTSGIGGLADIVINIPTSGKESVTLPQLYKTC